MGRFFGIASQTDCIQDLFFGTDYHSHLGTKRGGLAVIQPDVGFVRTIHNIETAQFRSKFDQDISNMHSGKENFIFPRWAQGKSTPLNWLPR